MTIEVKHTFQSAKPQGADATKVRKDDWNGVHNITMASGYVIGRAAAGNGVAEEIPVTAAGRAVMNGADAAAIRSYLSALALADVVGKQSIWIPAQSFFDTVAPPTKWWPSFGFMQVALDSVTAEGFGFVVRMPKSWNKSTLEFQYVWAHPATTVNFGVYVDITAAAYGNDELLTTGAWSAVGGVADTGGTTSDLYISPTFTLTPEAVGGSIGDEDLVTFWGSRRPANVADTLAVDMYMLGVTMKYTTNAARDD